MMSTEFFIQKATDFITNIEEIENNLTRKILFGSVYTLDFVSLLSASDTYFYSANK